MNFAYRFSLMKSHLYSMPKYYEVAFSHRNIAKEVDFLEAVFKVHSNMAVCSILDIACGTCMHSFELAKRGYSVDGLDASAEMLKYARKKFGQSPSRPRLLKADMKQFSIGERYDAAICMGDSLIYLLNDEDYCSHLSSVARVLERGGIYVVDLDNPNYWFGEDLAQESRNEWETLDESIRVKITLQSFSIFSKTKMRRLKISLHVRDGKKEYKNECYYDSRALFREDFGKLVNRENSFELLNCYGDFDLKQKYSKRSQRMITILRRK